MRLSNNFKLEEFERSNTAGQLGIDNTAPREAIDNLSRLCTLLLQPLRDYYKTKIFINSGYRSPDLNTRIGGTNTYEAKPRTSVSLAWTPYRTC